MAIFQSKYQQGKKGGQRPLRVGEMLRQALSEILMREDFLSYTLGKPVSVTISEVKVSPDLRNATVYIMPLAGTDPPRVLAALKDNAPELRQQLNRKVTLRYSPRLTFRLDDSFEVAEEVSGILKTVKPEDSGEGE